MQKVSTNASNLRCFKDQNGIVIEGGNVGGRSLVLGEFGMDGILKFDRD